LNEIANNKHQITNKFKIAMTKTENHFEFRIFDLFVIYNLRFEI